MYDGSNMYSHVIVYNIITVHNVVYFTYTCVYNSTCVLFIYNNKKIKNKPNHHITIWDFRLNSLMGSVCKFALLGRMGTADSGI